MEVIVCQTGVKRHAPNLHLALAARGLVLGSVECFDRCETCETFLIARIDGATVRFEDSDALLDALTLLAQE